MSTGGQYAIKYEEFPRMITVWEAWFAFLGLVEPHVFTQLMAGNEPHLFVQFATKIGGLTHRQAEAVYWKDWFWTVLAQVSAGHLI
jgi:hypothetical protein